MSVARYLGLLILMVGVFIALLVASGWQPPYRYNPWARLDLRAEPDWLTRFRLYRLQHHDDQCLAALAQAGAEYRAVPDRPLVDGCGWQGAVMLRGTGQAMLATPTVVTCPLAASLVMLDAHVLQPRAASAFGSPVAVIEHVGSYSCRNIRGDDGSALSSHARAEAIDITGFRLKDGRDISVASDWKRPVSGAFLHEIQAQSCGYFGVALGPDYNAAHAGHFHLQAGAMGWCR